ncbi:sigma-70 family RNA polymerase sigma factor [Streptomyces caniferus]|uniref:BACON domain-containing protein n=1 Tax=Streptomyces caniferus TaxID=285557 RepID=UPI002E2AAA01|nr:sigma-70 family RNA polymerase sigma factor [Streptomyces caniferus]
MSSRPEHPTHSTGAHRSRGDGRRRSRPQPSERPGPDAARPPEKRPDGYEPYLDGLFTYCLSVLCEHDAATAVLGEMLALAERHHGRRPADRAQYRSWLYALARWACLRRLAERTGPAAPGPSAGATAAAEAERRQRELAALAWPEAAGTTPEQREALELAVRHQLSADEVAAVLGADPIATRALLATASCEVERTRAALAVVESGRCREVAQLAGDTQMLLGAALSRELVRHVDDCAECRRTAERATAPGTWPGTAPVARGSLPLVAAPREAVLGALAAARRAKSGRAEGVAGAGRGGRNGGANGSPRYDRSGFPVGPPTDRVARRRRLRGRALTTTVVATVVAAPVLALWAAYHGGPATDEAADASPSVTASDTEPGGRLGGRPYENAGNARTTPDPGFRAGAGGPDVSVEVISADGTPQRPGGPGGRAESGPGRLTVAAQPSGRTTVITLSASGGAPVRWRASAGAAWLQLSHTAGTLRPGETTTITVDIDHDREPAGRWRARIAIEPGGTAVTMEGHGVTGPAPGPQRPTPAHPTPRPSHPTPTPTPTPTSPAPSSTPATPTPKPTGPEPSSTPSNTTRPAR